MRSSNGIERRNIRAIIVSDPTAPAYLRHRTLRSLLKCGLRLEQLFDWPSIGFGRLDLRELAAQSFDGSLWILRAGCWLVRGPLNVPPASCTGRPVIGLGTVRTSGISLVSRTEIAEAWQELQRSTGGELEQRRAQIATGPFVKSCWLDCNASSALLQDLRDSECLISSLAKVISNRVNRLIHWSALDVQHDTRLRAIQIITSLQVGGAERIAIDLHKIWMRNESVSPALIALGKPSRKSFPKPDSTIELGDVGLSPDRLAHCLGVIDKLRPDVVHCHLLTAQDQKRLASCGVPVIATVHNARAGWPHGFEQLVNEDARLLVACSKAVENDLKKTLIPIPIRTVWNGIDGSRYDASPEERQLHRSKWAAQLSLSQSDFLVLALANPRPQKRLERLPSVVSLAQAMLDESQIHRKIHLLIAGEPARNNGPAKVAIDQLKSAIADHSLGDRVHLLGAIDDVDSVLAAVDALVSVSDYEGLSLAHLEALASGVPVVATPAGGTAEIGGRSERLFLVAANASDHEIAGALVAAMTDERLAERTPSAAIAKDFSHVRMRDGYLSAYQRVANAAYQVDKNGLLLVINNFSTGGAQSSAKRLLLGLHDSGVHVRAAVLQESPCNPTPGRQSLIAAGIRVQVLEPAGSLDPLRAIDALLDEVDRTPPQAILLWNVIPEYKVLLVDQLISHDVYDVSPGEMNFSSFDRYFSRPRPGLPYRTAKHYGERLAGAIVKYERERKFAREVLQTTVHVVPNGVPVSNKTVQHGTRERMVFGTSARINPQKRLEDLIASFRFAHEHLPAYELRIAGGVEAGCDGYSESLRELAKGLPVVWLGELSDPTDFLLSLDVFVMISEPAGCPNASLEAMAVGLPMIVTDVGGAGEQVVDGLNGRLTPPRDPQSFAEAMIEVANDPELRVRFGRQSHLRVVERFSTPRMVADYRRILGL